LGLPHILVVLASTRQGRFGDTVLRWLSPIVEARADLTQEPVDLRDWQLPYYSAPVPAAALTTAQAPTTWAHLVGSADGFLIVTPEYNHGYPAVLKSALDAVYAEWNRKPIAFVSYGGWSGGTRAVEQLRQVAIELQMAPIRNALAFQFAAKLFDDQGHLKNSEFYTGAAQQLLDELVWWATALKKERAKPAS
jgi:NAD(P)H-dependent FMN reductase